MKALEQLSYGTFVLTIKKGEKKNGCILNTVIQIDEDTLLMSLQNFSYTNSLCEENDYITIHTIHKQAPRSIFENFGWKSGRNENKFDNVNYVEDEQFVILCCDGINNYFKGKIRNKIVLETHTLYVVHILSAEVLNEIDSLTYNEYQKYTKPQYKTRRNLEEAFKNESMARNKYTFYASVAKSEGFANISELFLKIAGNEKEHGEIWAKQLGLIGDTQENLMNSIDAENKEWQEDYKQFEKEAREEGYDDLAEYFKMIQTIECDHACEFNNMLEQLENGTLYEDKDEVEWICRNCGYIYTGKVALMKCPMCDHPQGYMERKC